MAHLIVIFKDAEEFQAAKVWFEEESDFYADRIDERTKALFFEDQDIDTLEIAITDELVEEGFESYYFRNDF